MENKKKTTKSKPKSNSNSKSKSNSNSKQQAKPNPKPKPKPKPKAKQSEKPKILTKKYSSGITIVRDNDENTSIDEYYDRKMNGIIKRIKDQNQLIDDKIRFGWNNSS